MVDFLVVATKKSGNNLCIYPKFRLYPKSKDLMIRGSDFYAIWLEDKGIWSTNEDDALNIIDKALEECYVKNLKDHPDMNITVLYTWDGSSGSIDSWHKYCQKQKRDSYKMLDEKIIFLNDKICREDYSSKSLSYPLEKGDISAYDELMNVLYDKENRHKIEWAIGSIVNGDSKWIQKFLVFYGAAGTGKSTVLNIIQDLFDGYWTVFDAKALGSSSAAFALEPFKMNPLVAIQHDGDLSKIEDNTRLNSLVSHELMTVNEKYKTAYANRFKCFLFMGTNRPVKITDAKSGLVRRLIDVNPTGNKVPSKRYKELTREIKFELGPIAWHCKKVYEKDPDYYNNYVPTSMMSASNDFYNFVLDSYHIFKREEEVSLKTAWEMYKNYCLDANVPHPFTKRVFKEEMKNYFTDFKERVQKEGDRLKNIYTGFKTEIFDVDQNEETPKEDDKGYVIEFKTQESIFDKECKDCLAQYASSKETPSKKWDDVSKCLKDIDTSRIHYVKIPENHIVIDFDLKDENGNKSFDKNLEAASKWPATYAELSKSGAGIHLHYIYTGDVTKLSRVYADSIEIKVFTGKSSLRRKLSKCNNLPIKSISSGLPMKGETKMISDNVIKSEILVIDEPRTINGNYLWKKN